MLLGVLLLLFVLLLLRVPIALAMAIPALVYIVSEGQSFSLAAQQSIRGVDSFAMLAVPLFVFVGLAANASGITDRLYTFAMALVGRVRGALGYVNVLVSMLFSWMSGAAVADAAGLGAIEVPAMKKRGYDTRFSLGVTASSALIGPMMPPSIPAVIYAVTAGISVGGMFLAGVGPAFLLTFLLCVHVYVWARRHPELREASSSLAGVGKAGLGAAPPLLTPVLILGGILGGIFTPTEAAGAAALYICVLGLAYRSMDRGAFARVALEAGRITASIMIIVASARLFGWMLARENAPLLVADAVLALTDDPVTFLLLVNVALLLIGMFMEATAAILVVVPVMQPLLISFDIDPMHFGVILLLNLFIGLVTPPVGILLYVLGKATGEPVSEVFKGVLPFYIPLLTALMLVTFVPQISLLLPATFGQGV